MYKKGTRIHKFLQKYFRTAQEQSSSGSGELSNDEKQEKS